MARSPASLGQELSQLREGMENAYYRQRTVEQRLRTVLRQAGRSAIRIEVFDVVGANQREPSVPAGHAGVPAPGAWPRARARPPPPPRPGARF